MRRAVALAFVLAGCYSPNVTPGVACVNACPGAQVCIDGVCRDPGFVGDAMPDGDPLIDSPPDVDTDGDGVLDSADNCDSLTNPDQHDEDADAFGDPCDPCPHLAMNGIADQDGDGVGDACDPEPANGRQRWAYFDPFTSKRAEWSSAPMTMFAGDQMRLRGYIELDLQVPDARVQGAGQLTVGADVPHQAVMEFGQLDDDHDYYVEFYDEGEGGGVKISKYDAPDFIAVTSDNYSGSIAAGAFMWTTDYSLTAQTVAFTAEHGTMSYPTMTAPTTSPALGSTQFLFFGAINVTMAYDYLAVIETM